MYNLFIEGGVLFMSILTIELLVAVALSVLSGMAILSGKNQVQQRHDFIKSMGTLALVTGVLGQFIGLYTAFEYIGKEGQVTQQILAQGLKVSSITSIYGLIIFILAYLLWFGLEALSNKKQLN